VDLSLLKSMHHIADAAYSTGNMNRCLRGTRRDLLLQIEQWSVQKREKRVFWLSGFAGTGKSTIARTFAETSFFYGNLGASFFCSRHSRDRSNLQAIIPTLAFQLAHRYRDFRQELLKVLRANPIDGQASLCSQLENLIIHPLKEARISTLIVIDALDECKDKESTSAFLSLLSRYIDEIPEVKILITSRPEPPIQLGFRLERLRPVTDILKLHNIERSSVDEDIRHYLKVHLTGIKSQRLAEDKRTTSQRMVDYQGTILTYRIVGAQKARTLSEEWPTPYDIDTFCKMAAGLFIYASKMVEFIASKSHLPTERLDLILSSQNAAREVRIDPMYTNTLKLVSQDAWTDEKELYSDFRTVVGAVLVVFHPLSRKALSDLVRNCGTPSSISTTLRSLHSLLDVPDSENDPIRVFHPSFTHFLTDRTRCKDRRFFVDPPVHHQDILFSCLDLMNERLKKNICNLDDYVSLNEVENLSARRETCIGGSLQYACRFWTRHLASIPSDGSHTERLQEAMDEFLTKRLLYWIEILSILGCLEVAVYAINDIRQWYISVSHILKAHSHIARPHTPPPDGNHHFQTGRRHRTSHPRTFQRDP
jgi:hypothetical protein